MIERVNRYYQLPGSKQLIDHMRKDIGLHGEYLEIFDELRDKVGSTQMHADEIGITAKQFNAMAGVVGQTCIWELVRLAEIGLKVEQKSSQ